MSVTKIAVTGGIGSGKSTVCNIIKNLGYSVFSCDEIYSQLIKNPDFLCGVYKTVEIENMDSTLPFNREAVSKKIFFNPLLKRKLEEYTHPQILKNVLLKMNACEGIAFVEVPLLFEGNYQCLFDGVIVVIRPLEERIKAASLRDSKTKEEVLDIIKNQFDYENFNALEHNVVVNDCDIITLEERVRGAVEKFKV